MNRPTKVNHLSHTVLPNDDPAFASVTCDTYSVSQSMPANTTKRQVAESMSKAVSAYQAKSDHSTSSKPGRMVTVMLVKEGSTTPRLTEIYTEDPNVQPYSFINRSGIPYGVLKRMGPNPDDSDDDYESDDDD